VSIQPNTRVNVLAGAILGLIVGLLLAFVLEYLDDTLKSSADVERFVGLTTLGAIPVAEK
jgi:capsular polysaccharide biosynthesis protein